MLKSSKLVLGLGILVGLSIVALPTRSFAATRVIWRGDIDVTATVNGVIGFTPTQYLPGSGYSYDSESGYIGSFLPYEYTSNIGATTYEVVCNYRSAAYSGSVYLDDDEDGIYETPATTSDGTTITGANSDCSSGWYVSAVSTYNDGNGNATMQTSTTPAYTITSTSFDTNPLGGATANWGMRVNSISKTVDSESFSTTPATGYDTLHAVPATSTSVVSGNTFRTVGGVANTYIGNESFSVQYAFNAGFAAAGTYIGEVTYTLYVGN